MKQNIMFIIFPGNVTTSKHFKLNYVGKKPLKDWDDPDIGKSTKIAIFLSVFNFTSKN